MAATPLWDDTYTLPVLPRLRLPDKLTWICLSVLSRTSILERQRVSEQDRCTRTEWDGSRWNMAHAKHLTMTHLVLNTHTHTHTAYTHACTHSCHQQTEEPQPEMKQLPVDWTLCADKLCDPSKWPTGHCAASPSCSRKEPGVSSEAKSSGQKNQFVKGGVRAHVRVRLFFFPTLLFFAAWNDQSRSTVRHRGLQPIAFSETSETRNTDVLLFFCNSPKTRANMQKETWGKNKSCPLNRERKSKAAVLKLTPRGSQGHGSNSSTESMKQNVLTAKLILHESNLILVRS